MEKKMIQNKTEKETQPTTQTTEKPAATSETPTFRRRNRRRLAAW